ncbi:MAG: SUMF1/EgtB/PvdO family nonheme iron enzyme [Bacteroidales bacterium]|nr:SUMF1/EgtB/PvdO family nonheme iron enzyme [Candidatus Physcocola equi]
MKNENTKSSDTLSFTVNGVSFKMKLVKHGSFAMGATAEMENPNSDEKPVHQVTITKDYYMGETSVTQSLWEAVMGGNPSRFRGENNPVENVTWDDCHNFISKMNELTGKQFRLPTEAEWEYAARGGNKSRHTQYAGSANLEDVAWYDDNSGGHPHPVAQKQSNELGLYDMSGNVWEWCQDWFNYYSNSPSVDPQGPTSGPGRVLRGGCWNFWLSTCSSSSRGWCNPDSKFSIDGFRLAL